MSHFSYRERIWCVESSINITVPTRYLMGSLSLAGESLGSLSLAGEFQCRYLSAPRLRWSPPPGWWFPWCQWGRAGWSPGPPWWRCRPPGPPLSSPSLWRSASRCRKHPGLRPQSSSHNYPARSAAQSRPSRRNSRCGKSTDIKMRRVVVLVVVVPLSSPSLWRSASRCRKHPGLRPQSSSHNYPARSAAQSRPSRRNSRCGKSADIKLRRVVVLVVVVVEMCSVFCIYSHRTRQRTCELLPRSRECGHRGGSQPSWQGARPGSQSRSTHCVRHRRTP